MPDDQKPDDEKAFNETLKRMLKTPPKPHEKAEPIERHRERQRDDKPKPIRNK